MKRLTRSFTLTALLCLGSLAGSASAHQMWIESLTEPPRVVVRFGEFGDSVEKSPGYLDQLAPVLAWLPAAAPEMDAKVLSAVKKADHFVLEPPADAPVALAQTAFPVMGKEGAPGRLPLFYLRWHAAGPAEAAADQKPAMTLDLVPEGKGKVRVFFRSVPVAGASLTLMAGGKETPLTADAEGRVLVPEGPAGPVLLTVNQKEDLPGNYLGKLYSITSHNASLSWVRR